MENELKARSRGFSTDMSPDAIANRLDVAGDWYDAVAWLGRFVPVDNAPFQAPISTEPQESTAQS